MLYRRHCINGNACELAPAEFRKTKPDFQNAPESTVNLKIISLSYAALERKKSVELLKLIPRKKMQRKFTLAFSFFVK